MNEKYLTIELERQEALVTLWLNRPEKHNAFDDTMIAELTAAFREVAALEAIRLVILRGRGKSFCAGADLNYMKGVAAFGYQENFEDARKLAGLFEAVYSCPLPTLGVAHGAVFGGANGLLAACDVVVADEGTTFAFSEVKIGVAPATIGPFVLKRTGEFRGKELMMTGRRFKGREAERYGLVNRAVPGEELKDAVDSFVMEFMTAAPGAVRSTKEMIVEVMNGEGNDISEYTADLIARLRASEEGQEGMAAFLGKRRPNWNI